MGDEWINICLLFKYTKIGINFLFCVIMSIYSSCSIDFIEINDLRNYTRFINFKHI